MNKPLNNAPAPPSILVVDDHAIARQSVVDVLRMCGFKVEACSSGAEALQRIKKQSFQLMITDLQMPGMSGLDLIREIERRRIDIQILMVTAHASIDTAVEAMQLGAFDYLEKPYDVDRLEQSVRRAVENGQLLTETREKTVTTGDSGPIMIGSSVAMQQLRSQLARIAATDETVLICGESGVGKELVAKTVHTLSNRSQGPMISLNCPVLSEQLTESELFGHCRGAFTGADADRTGRFEMAEGGTLLLDEITEINLGLQAKLLRVLQEHSFERVGSSKTETTDVRVIATTNRDLHDEISAGRFREDLYYRLAVVPVQVPPLRERGNDVLELAQYFLEQAAAKQSREVLVLEASARELLLAHSWPGNIRELHNVITRACVLADGPSITADLIRNWLRKANNIGDRTTTSSAAASSAILSSTPLPSTTAISNPVSAPTLTLHSPEATDDLTNESTTASNDTLPAAATLAVGMSLAEVERVMILATLAKYDGHRAKTAEVLGIGVRTLSGKLRDYGVAPREKNFSRAA